MAGGLLLIVQASRVATAAQWTEAEDIGKLNQATRLDPGNALAENRLGFLYLREASDVTAALPHLRRATELNPRVAVYWVDLANGYEMSGQLDGARDAYERAAALAPMRPDFTWELANYYLRAGESDKALTGFARYLHLVPSAREQAFAILGRGLNDPALVWEKVVRVSGDPETEVGYLAYLKFQNAAFSTARFWNELVAQGKPMPASTAVRYVDRLLENQEYGEAKRVWSDLQKAGAVPANAPDGNLVFNPNFEQKFLNGGFDWRIHQEPFVDFDLPQSGFCKENRCLYLNFSVPHNSDYEPAFEIVPVKPNQTYTLSAFVRSQDITSDSGPRLRVLDAQCPTCLDVSTPAALETRAWHKVDTTFTTGPNTQAIKLSVWRPRSRVFPMEISGEFWLDSVSLKPVTQAVTP
jgi:hypothetical protein